MNVILWVVQCLLAVVNLLAGVPKASLPITALSKPVGWIGAVPAALVRFIGAAELLGAIGLILPLLTGILPWLTVAAALCLAVLQVCATLFHISRGEVKSLPANAVLLSLSLFVIVGRVFIVPVM